MSMICRPMWSFLLMYGSHEMRHTGFPQVDGGQRDPRESRRHTIAGMEEGEARGTKCQSWAS